MQEIKAPLDANRIVEITFEKSPEYRLIHATGFWGGVTPLGELVFDIIEDVPRYPDVVRILPPNREEREPEEDTKIRVRRIQHIGVTIPMTAVPDIINWLQRKLEEYQQLKQAQGNLKT